MLLCLEQNVKWYVLHEIRLLDTQDLLAAQSHEELRELLDAPLAVLVHVLDLLIDCHHELLQHQLDLDLPLVLVAHHHLKAVHLFGLNALGYGLQGCFFL